MVAVSALLTALARLRFALTEKVWRLLHVPTTARHYTPQAVHLKDIPRNDIRDIKEGTLER